MREGVVAYVVREASRVRRPGKKALQKLIYFVQEAGVPLGFRYGMHLFGPYSETLSAFVDGQTLDGTLRYDREGMSTLVIPGPGCEMAIEEDRQTLDQYRDILEKVLSDFSGKSPLDLEIMSTIHFVAKQYPNDEDKIINSTLQLKGDKSSLHHIRECLAELRRLKYVGGDLELVAERH